MILGLLAMFVAAALFGTQTFGFSVKRSAGPSPAELQSVDSFGLNAATNLGALFSFVKSLSIELNFTDNQGSVTCQWISYFVAGIASVDGEADYLVNVTGIATTGNHSDHDSTLIWVNANSGQVLQLYMDNKYYASGQASSSEQRLFGLITGSTWISMMNSTTFSEGSQSYEVFNGRDLGISTYQSTSSASQFEDWTIKVVTIPLEGGSIDLVRYSSYLVPSSGARAVFKIMSLSLS